MTRLIGRGFLGSLALAFLAAATPGAQGVITLAQPPGAPNPSAPGTPPPRPVSPDVSALQAAQRIPDNDNKIGAIEKWLKDFPESGSRQQAYTALFDTLVKHRPTDRAAILDAAQKGIDAAQEGFRASGYSRFAGALLTAGMFLDDAAVMAETGLTVFEDEQNKQMQRARATHLGTLGRIRIKQGRVADGEKLLKEAYAANPEIPSALIGLAEVAEGRKDSKAALDYWLQASLTGRLSKEDRAKLEAFYKNAHNGSLDGLDAALDAKYSETSTNPVHTDTYKVTAARSNRLVLAEVFTGAGCGPCIAADLAFDAAMERYPRKDLAVVMYHMHIPLPDPLTNQSTVERAKYYSINGVPSYAIDGSLLGGGGGDRSYTKRIFSRLVPDIEKELEAESGGELTLEASLAGGVVKATATPARLGGGGNAVKLQILLVEELLAYSGENGIRFHPMVVRSIGGANFGGFTVDRGAPVAVEHVFDLAQITEETQKYIDDYEKTRASTQSGFTFSRKPVAMNSGNLAVVAFLQEEKSKQILQSSYVRLHD
jgi:thiol-disulfide isomerase/thioredoxin